MPFTEPWRQAGCSSSLCFLLGLLREGHRRSPWQLAALGSTSASTWPPIWDLAICVSGRQLGGDLGRKHRWVREQLARGLLER